MAIAGASQLIAGLFLLPLVPFDLSKGPITAWVIFNVLVFALVCSAVAYLLYYRLIADVGPAKALTVTFLMPLFGMLWGCWFLNETITIRMMVGCLLTILGTVLAVRSKIAPPAPAS